MVTHFLLALFIIKCIENEDISSWSMLVCLTDPSKIADIMALTSLFLLSSLNSWLVIPGDFALLISSCNSWGKLAKTPFTASLVLHSRVALYYMSDAANSSQHTTTEYSRTIGMVVP